MAPLMSPFESLILPTSFVVAMLMVLHMDDEDFDAGDVEVHILFEVIRICWPSSL